MLSSEPSRSAVPTGPVLRLSRAAANKAFIVYAVLLLVGGWSYAVLSIQTDYHRTLEETRNQLRTVAAGFEAQVDAMLNDGIGAAFAAAKQLEASGSLSAASDTEASATLARMLTGGEYVRSLFIGSSTWFARAGREGHLEQGAPPPWFNALTDPEPGGDAVAGSLVADPDRPPHRVIPIARRVGTVHYRDVWVGGLFDFHELNDLYRKSIGPASALLLLSLDGNILVRVPNLPGVDASKTPIGNTDLFRRAMSTPNAGVVEGIAPLMLTPAIAAYQRVSGYPLYVAAGVRRDAALASWETRRRDTLVLTAVASVILIAMTWMLNHYVGALRGRELHYRTLFNNAGFSAFMLDGDEFIEANRTTLSMFAMPEGEQVRGLKPWDVSPERQPDGRLRASSRSSASPPRGSRARRNSSGCTSAWTAASPSPPKWSCLPCAPTAAR